MGRLKDAEMCTFLEPTTVTNLVVTHAGQTMKQHSWRDLFLPQDPGQISAAWALREEG